MSYQADTVTGTITLVDGETAFVTSGVELQTRGHMAGDTIYRNGLVLIIAEIVDEDNGVLLDPCPGGAAGAAVPVRIRFQPDGSRVKAEARNLVELLGEGTLESIAALDGVEDDLLIFSSVPNQLETLPGASVKALAAIDNTDNLTAYATIPDVSGIPILAGLGANPIQASQYDATANRLMLNGAFGLGSVSMTPLNAQDLNTLFVNGLYYCTAPTNGPVADTFVVEVGTTDQGSGRGWQRATIVNGTYQVWGRSRLLGVWGAWVDITYGPVADSRVSQFLFPHVTTTDSTTDFNTLITPGWQRALYRCGVIYCPNSPPLPSGIYCHVQVMDYNNVTLQVAYPYGGNLASGAYPLCMRGLNPSTGVWGAWSSWGPNSGLVANGAASEFGANANGTYAKFVDGTMICTFVMSTGKPVASAAGSIFTQSSGTTWTFPAAFVITQVNPSVYGSDAASINVWVVPQGGTATSVVVNGMCYVSVGSNRIFYLTAIGRWK